ncbi:thiamine biosynthesis lipoprotein [Nakamurella panacisegetis]|uniref:FAD:protein FMN transferase n=1 Tax=Nakamurella panacisegetis TaxID=1090615 RepID=A0A1H0KZV4_9ACTN|nr:FAD:protein FMN transferase [Nakamurella panacisegetis]SDO61271.1 thiamine biosynthesis lipoprotein [Nakamurella panacisegetis]
MSARTEMIMGLPVSIHLRDGAPGRSSEARALAATDAAFGEMRHFDQIFSPYRDDSTLTAVRSGRVDVAQAGDEFTEMLERADEAKTLTDGAFDVRFAGELEPSGLVKGWAAERAGAHLAALDLDWYLNAGGDITVGGTAEPWRLGIEHPADPSGLITVVQLRTGGIATSGSAHRGAHIIDPLTGTAASGIRQVTVIGPSLARADVWATAIAARGSAALISADDHLVRNCVADGYQVFAVAADGRICATEGFAEYQVNDLPRPAVRPFAALA